MNLKSNDFLDTIWISIKKVFIFLKNLAISIYIFLKQKVFIPIKNGCAALVRFIKSKLFFKKLPTDESEIEPSKAEPVTESVWKTKALEDFQLWLSEMPFEQPPAMTATPDACDIYTMLSEFTALRQEIKLYNKDQNRTVAALNSVKGVTDEYGQIYTLFKEKTNQIAQLEQNIRMQSEKKAAFSFFDVRDSLIDGYKKSVEMSQRKGFFRRPPKDIYTICEGYEMAISRFDKSLSAMDIEPVQTDNMPFNSETMKVVETRIIPGIENGIVVETVSGGFVRGGELLRFAKVVVAQAPAPSS